MGWLLALDVNNWIFKAGQGSPVQSMQNHGDVFQRQIHFFRKGEVALRTPTRWQTAVA